MRLFGQKAKKSVSDNNYALNGLRQNCDPEPLIKLATATGQADVHKKVLPFLMVNGLWALVAGGCGEAALPGLLQWRDQLDSPKGNDMSRCQCHLLLSEVYAQLERWQEAVAEQNRAMEFYGLLSPKELEDDLLRWMLCRSGYDLQLHQGRTEGMEPLLLQLLDTAPDPWRLAEIHLLLGRYYKAVEEKEKAEEHLGYTAGHGNALFAKYQAEKLLRELRGEGPNGEDLTREAQRKMRDLSDPLNPQPALEVCLEALDRPEVQEAPMWSALLRLSAGADLVNLGRYEEALEQLALISPGLSILSQPAVKIQVLHLSLLARMGLGQLSEAAKLQQEAVELFSREKALEPCRWALTRTGYELRVRQGHLEGVEGEAKGLLDTARNEVDRLSARMLLGRYYLAAEEREKAREHLEYVVEHGGKHHFRRDAEELLGVTNEK